MNQEMPTFDISQIPMEFSPFPHLDAKPSSTEGDDKLFVQFKVEAVMNPSKSTKAGRPIFDDVDMVVIRTPGSQLTSIIAPMKGEYLQRFRAPYEKWKASHQQAISGTPLENFLIGQVSMVAELKALHIQTVEQLAAIPDSAKQRIMGGHELSRRAVEWLDRMKGVAEDKEKDELKARLADLESKLAAMTAAPTRRGRQKAEESEPAFLSGHPTE
jgi:hypothetical protein